MVSGSGAHDRRISVESRRAFHHENAAIGIFLQKNLPNDPQALLCC